MGLFYFIFKKVDVVMEGYIFYIVYKGWLGNRVGSLIWLC